MIAAGHGALARVQADDDGTAADARALLAEHDDRHRLLQESPPDAAAVNA